MRALRPNPAGNANQRTPSFLYALPRGEHYIVSRQ